MKKNFILIGIIVVTAVFSYLIGWGVCLFQATPDTDPNAIEKAVSEAETEVEELKNELKKTKAQLKKAKANSKTAKSSDFGKTSTSAVKEDIYKKIFEAIFYDVEGDFVMNSSDFKFYSELSCTPDTLITDDLTFITHRDVDGVNSSGDKVFISRTTKGPVFSVEQPFFDPKN